MMLSDLHERIIQKHKLELEMCLSEFLYRGESDIVALIVWNLILNPLCSVLLAETYMKIKQAFKGENDSANSMFVQKEIDLLRQEIQLIGKNSSFDVADLKNQCRFQFKRYALPPDLVEELTSEITTWALERYGSAKNDNL